MTKLKPTVTFAAIDPYALLFDPARYVQLIEGRFPHVPRVLDDVVQQMTAEERDVVLKRARLMQAAAAKVEQAVTPRKLI